MHARWLLQAGQRDEARTDLQALQQQKLAAAEIASRAFNNELTWQEADREIAALGNPYDSFNKYKSVAGGSAGELSPDALNYLNKP